MERADVQGLVLYSYKRHPRSRFYLLRFGEGKPREWLRRVLTDVTAGHEDRDAKYRFNLAFSAPGLAALGLDEEDLATFQREFVQGMAHPERSDVLGDHYSDAPEKWQWGGSQDQRIDALAMLYGRSDEELGVRAGEIEALLERYGIQFRIEDVSVPHDRREHFGFADGSSQPIVKGSGAKAGPGDTKIATGEFVLGYPNAYGKITQVPSAVARRGTREHPAQLAGSDRVAFGQNGSYLVLRKLRQDVAGFWQYCFEAAEREGAPDLEAGAKLIASRFVGRWPNGVSLVQSPDAERPPQAGMNDFRYREADPDGLKCPFGAHTRRSNPRDMFGDDAKEGLRDANLHRLLRRGRVYGPRLAGVMPRVDDGAERGLLFIALNANLRRQFEFVQQTWVNSCKFANLSDERDPLVGKEAFDLADQPVPRVFTAPARPARRRYEGIPKVITLRGGEYFFMPSLRALNYLCDGSD